MNKNYINLTNGIQAIKEYNLTEYSFIRIQSTALEQKRWDFILQDLDNDFLMNLAIGNECIVYDYSAKKTKSRACYQGIPFIKYVLNRFWFDFTYEKNLCRNYDCSSYFNDIYHNLEKRTFKKLSYFKKFLQKEINCVNIHIINNNTKHDGNIEFYKRELINEN